MIRIPDNFTRLRISKPTLVLDKARVLRNIERMATRARKAGVAFRPHFKTHQSAEIGRWFRDFGVSSITVSSVEMAEYFAHDGWLDITVAVPVNLRELSVIDSLCGSVTLNLLVDSEDAVRVVNDALTNRACVWIKVDSGYGRVGIPWNDQDRIAAIASSILKSPRLEFQGILTHSGQSYNERSADGVRRVHLDAVARMLTVKQALEAGGVSRCKVSVGDTPTASVLSSFDGVDEIRPGNFVFYDVAQHMIGSCSDEDIAVGVACPVVGKYPERRRIALFGGAAHLSKESVVDQTGHRVFGYLALVEGDTLGRLNHSAPVVSLSQEHGIVELDHDLLGEIEIGDVVLVLPIHSCLTSNLHTDYRTLEGEVIWRM